MKKIQLLILVLVPSIFYSQNLIKDYKPPEIMEGSNLILSTSPDFEIEKYTAYSGGSEDKMHYYMVNAGLDYIKFRFTRKLNYSFSANLNTLVRERSSSTLLFYDLRTNAGKDEKERLAGLRTGIRGGINYYFYKTLIYGAVFSDINYDISSRDKPYADISIYPAVGSGQIFDAGRITGTNNIQQVLLDEKIISKPLPKKTAMRLTELQDRRYENEYSVNFKDDADIEFFTQVENVLRDEGIINGALGSRAVLKIYQALINNKYFYFPNYKGYQVQAEIKYLAGNDESRLNSIIFSGIYGLPFGLTNNLTSSVFFTVPVKPDYLQRFYDYEFHSPLTLLYRLSNNDVVPHFDAVSYGELMNFAAGTKINFYHLLNRTAGIVLSFEGNYARIKDGKNKSSFNLSAVLRYNILNRMVCDLRAGYFRNYFSEYTVYANGRLSYYIF